MCIANGIFITSLILVFYSKRKGHPDIKSNGDTVCIAGIKMDIKRRRVYINNNECPFRKMEFDLLYLFLKSPDHFLTREVINQKLWPNENLADVDNRINSHVNRIKNKLKDFPEYEITTVRALGYQFSYKDINPAQLPIHS